MGSGVGFLCSANTAPLSSFLIFIVGTTNYGWTDGVAREMKSPSYWCLLTCIKYYIVFDLILNKQRNVSFPNSPCLSRDYDILSLVFKYCFFCRKNALPHTCVPGVCTADSFLNLNFLKSSSPLLAAQCQRPVLIWLEDIAARVKPTKICLMLPG